MAQISKTAPTTEHPMPVAGETTLSETLRLIRKYRTSHEEGIGSIFVRVALALEEAERPRRNDLGTMLNAWSFWGELGAELQSELLDCIEHTYGFAGPSKWAGFIKAHGSSENPAERAVS